MLRRSSSQPSLLPATPAKSGRPDTRDGFASFVGRGPSSSSRTVRLGSRSGLGEEDQELRQKQLYLQSLQSPNSTSLRAIRTATSEFGACGATPLGASLAGPSPLPRSRAASSSSRRGGALGTNEESAVDEASRRHFTACKESAVDEACKRHFTACKEHVQEIDLLFKSLASRSAQTPEDTAVDEAEERRQQLEEQRRALFQERQKARDPYRRVENRLSDARNYPLEDIGAGVAAGAGGSQKGSTGNLGSVPMTVVDIASASGNTQCPVVDVKKLQSLSKTLGKGMTVKDMVAMAPSPEVTIHSRKRLPKLASVPTTPQERKDALIEHVNRVRCQRQVCHMGRSLTRLNRMRGPTSDDTLKDFSSTTSSTFEAALRGGVASEFIRVWLDELGVVEELDTLRASQRMRKPARHLRLFRGVMRTVIIFMAHARRAAAANTIIVNLLKKHAMVFKTKLAFQRAAEFRARMAIFGRNFKSRREERLEEMLRQWQEIEDAFLQQNVPDEGELEEGLIRNSKAETSEDDEDMSQAANEDSEDAESAKAREDTADSEPRRSDWHRANNSSPCRAVGTHRRQTIGFDDLFA